MPASILQKKAVYFVAFSIVVILILVLLPFVERFVHGYVLAQLNLAVMPDGSVATAVGSAPGMMTETSVGILLNLFRLGRILLWMALIIAVVRFFGHLIFTTAFRTNQNEISSLVKTVLSIIVYIVAFFIIFQSQYPNVELAPLFTGSTIIGIVVGLALQDTLGNLFAGIALQADQGFQIGDVISISDRATGVVEVVSWRGVKIRTFQNKLLVISNAVMGKEAIEVAARGNLNARLVFFNTLYSNSPSKTIQVIREAVRQVENVSQKIRPIVRIRNLGDNGIDWEVKYWAEDYALYNDTDALVRQRIWYVFNREKIDFAYPTHTVYIGNEPVGKTPAEYVNSTSEYLSRVPIFAPLSQEELEKLARASNDRIFAPGELIVRKGQQGNSMFVITSGAVKVQVPQHNYAQTINNLRENDFFGEMSLLTGQPRSANVIATEETTVIQIRKSALRPIFEENPELVKSICDLIEERQLLLKQDMQNIVEDKETTSKGVMASIRNFFGLS
ncbi:MAG: mechanosensitive ion channel family protein [Blastocatellia bacterium]|nr:mechanosensitive ion channel family protein [Blastocatellia bacterium]